MNRWSVMYLVIGYFVLEEAGVAILVVAVKGKSKMFLGEHLVDDLSI